MATTMRMIWNQTWIKLTRALSLLQSKVGVKDLLRKVKDFGDILIHRSNVTNQKPTGRVDVETESEKNYHAQQKVRPLELGESEVFTSTKTYDNFPCAHRQWRAAEVGSNCAQIHGYSRSYRFTFEAYTRDRCGFIVDFGDLKKVKTWLESKFDHTTLLCHDDPLMSTFKELERGGAMTIVEMPDGVGMESSAEYVGLAVDAYIRYASHGRSWVKSVEAIENSKNSAIWLNPKRGFVGFGSFGEDGKGLLV